jgi:hypothetical protein
MQPKSVLGRMHFRFYRDVAAFLLYNLHRTYVHVFSDKHILTDARYRVIHSEGKHLDVSWLKILHVFKLTNLSFSINLLMLTESNCF